MPYTEPKTTYFRDQLYDLLLSTRPGLSPVTLQVSLTLMGELPLMFGADNGSFRLNGEGLSLLEQHVDFLHPAMMAGKDVFWQTVNQTIVNYQDSPPRRGYYRGPRHTIEEIQENRVRMILPKHADHVLFTHYVSTVAYDDLTTDQKLMLVAMPQTLRAKDLIVETNRLGLTHRQALQATNDLVRLGLAEKRRQKAAAVWANDRWKWPTETVYSLTVDGQRLHQEKGFETHQTPIYQSI